MSENYGDNYDNNHDSSDPKRKWRKKRKNFLSNAKKYAKKGQMGRGTKMSEELYQYFVGILEAIKKGIEDEEERRKLLFFKRKTCYKNVAITCLLTKITCVFVLIMAK